jgi:hypothetical protein
MASSLRRKGLGAAASAQAGAEHRERGERVAQDSPPSAPPAPLSVLAFRRPAQVQSARAHLTLTVADSD